MGKMPAGRRDRRIRIERYTVAQNGGTGEAVKTWATLTTVWAEKLDLSDRERVAAAEISAEITTRFRILYSSTVSGVNPKDRIVLDGRTYDIWGIKEIGTREGLEITAAARAD